ncbi:glutamyl-tRNA synthetase [Paenibacillus taihuensis]|uniref:Glutamyl-Q tRNA(Asp) synthetase n=1 Tax=Paenibacillus taihuensis TaxID=1156355 RepID=A0A3D9SGZ7_9BACL|nr:tRNA glutamyl-Q(34) synthetase GluQRS [Paenibacillus taihuensis]REE89052.1 glutamyl-tRNA synthetase [Paenibacillus taihuensis]
MMERRGRFAPTPSGQLHIGNAFTALCAWLQIRQADGKFLLRIEDIDKPRCRTEYARQQLDDLRWLGLDWDEGPLVDGPYGPYEQSSREPLYEEALQRLIRKGHVYPCYCSRADQTAIGSAPHGLSSEGAAYQGLCRSMSHEERDVRAITKAPSLRFMMPEEALSFEDDIAGTQAYASGDYIVKRADGMFSYQLAVTVDDAAMGITDVWRGSDLLDSTPRQLALYEALELKPPRFAHVPLIGDAEGNRLSKRGRSNTLAALRAESIPPERLVGLLSYLAGWKQQLEPAQPQELIPRFHTEQLNQPIISIRDNQLEWLRFT